MPVTSSQYDPEFGRVGVGVTPDYAIAQRLYPKLGCVHDDTGINTDECGGCVYSTKQLTRDMRAESHFTSYGRIV